MSEQSRVIKNITIVGLNQVINYLFPLISIPIISRIIGPEKLGVINFASSYVSYFILLIGYGFDLTATRRVASDPNNEEKRSFVFSEVLIAKLVLFLLSLLIFMTCYKFIPLLNYEVEVIWFSFLLCFSAIFTQNWLFQAMQDLPKVAVLNLISKICFTIAVLIIIRKESDYLWQPLILSITQISVSVFSFYWAIKKYNLKFYKINFHQIAKLLWSEKSFFLSLCIINLYTSTNVILLGLSQSSIQVGYYTAGQKMISIMQTIITVPLAQGVFPFIAKALSESLDKGIEIIQKMLPLVIGITFVSGISIYLLSPVIIHCFYGRDFDPSIKVCRILAFIPMIISLSTITGIHLLLNLKYDKVFFLITSIGAVFSLLMNVFLVKILGYIGSAITWVITELLILMLFYSFLRFKNIDVINLKYYNINYFTNLICKYRRLYEFNKN